MKADRAGYREHVTIPATTLDDLAPGRIILGIGAWWDPLAQNIRSGNAGLDFSSFAALVPAPPRQETY